MPLKSRLVTKPWKGNWRFSNNQPPTNYSGSQTVQSDTLDVSVASNRGGENPFESNVHKLTGSLGFSPTVPVGTGKWFATSGPSSFLGGGSFATATLPTAADIWARTNPTRPAFLAPVFFYELRDVPDMIRQAGRFLLHTRNWRDWIRSGSKDRDLASANLAFQFGWAPLVGDLYRISRFQESVDRRRRELEAVYSGRGLRRYVRLGDGVSTPSTSTGAANFGSFVNFAPTQTTTRQWEAWAVVHWKATQMSLPPPTDGELRRLLAGLSIGSITVNLWEALPWSWLIDYFTNIGAVLAAGNHTLGQPKGGSVMVRYTTRTTHTPLADGNLRLSAGLAYHEKRTRTPLAGISLACSLPTLGAGQLSILGSLAIQRAR